MMHIILGFLIGLLILIPIRTILMEIKKQEEENE